MVTHNSASPQVNKSILNNSVSKACYSFHKSPKRKDVLPYNDKIYDIPSMMSKRSTSLGYGKKLELIPIEKSPSPDKYRIESDFAQSMKKGQTFGVSRCNFKANQMLKTDQTPGPGDYELQNLEMKKKYFSMFGRNACQKLFSSNNNPGPGKYETKQDLDRSFYFNSTKKSPFTYSIGKQKKMDDKENNYDNGPGKYEIKLASMGRQVLAHKKTQKSFYFPRKSRDTLPVPKSRAGPGSYEHFSQFGR